MATVIDKAVAWAVAIAESPAHGYDQYGRWGPDYDCSSLVISAYEAAGVPVKSTYGATRTGNMYSPFLKAGFADVTAKVNLSTGEGLRKGDVVLRPSTASKTGHVEMMATSTTLVGAHISENGTITGEDGDQTGDEISIKPYSNKNKWKYVLRYPGGSSETVEPGITKDMIINSNKYLSVPEMYNNALYIAAYFMRAGWTLEAIAAILGNMQTESNMNPGIWESLESGNTSGGYGLVQWTPATKLIIWASGLGLDYTDIDTQLARIIWEMENGVQYYPTDNYPETFKEFSTSEKSPEYLAGAFLYNYERPKSPNAQKRGEQARYWYNILSDIDPDWLLGIGTEKKRKGLSLLLMYSAIRRRSYVV